MQYWFYVNFKILISTLKTLTDIFRQNNVLLVTEYIFSQHYVKNKSGLTLLSMPLEVKQSKT